MYTLQSILNWNSNLFNGIDVSLFNDLISDASTPQIDQDTLISNIILRNGLLEPIYGEPKLLQAQITIWWKSNFYNFFRIWEGMHINYNPIENYDRYENSQRNLESNNSSTDSGSDVTKNTGTDSTKNSGSDVSTDSKQDITEEKISAFNDAGYQPKTQNTIEYGKQNTYQHGKQTEITYGATSTFTHGKRNVYESNDKDIYASHTHGNIGVTTNQQMLTQELLLRQQNVYEIIAENFEQHICITVY